MAEVTRLGWRQGITPARQAELDRLDDELHPDEGVCQYCDSVAILRPASHKSTRWVCDECFTRSKRKVAS